MSENWKVSGTYIEACDCKVACPCVFGSYTSEGDCKFLAGWHIEEGRFGGVVLDGLNVAMMIYSPGEMFEVKWQTALYLDEQASAAQKNALALIFGGQVGGIPAGIASMVGQVLGVSSKKLVYQANGRQRSLKIAGVASSEIEAIEGLDGGEVTIHNLGAGAGHSPYVQAKSKQLNYHDYGMKWEISGKNGFYSSYAYQSD